ncbi:MAG TPA: mechanosensitive ion channel domain-containing protein [Candidatus Acidoferrum sp.]|nr:mechanosensitive ion channel domain-containing protein [Candidatus Acidoferrum sp.]
METNPAIVTSSSAIVTVLAFWGLRILGAALILIVGWLVSGWLSRLAAVRLEKTGRVDRTLSSVAGKIVRIAILIFTVLAVLEQFGVKTTSVLAVLGAAGLAIGLALQGALSNVASGVMLLVFRPFKVGDAVDFGTLGIVDEIGLFLTRMHTPDNIAMFVPNSKIWGNVILNYAVNDTRRVDMVFSISYGDSMDAAIRIVQEAIAAEPRFLKDPAPLVAVGELGDSSVNLFVRPWVKCTDFQDAKLAFTRKVKEQFDAQGITIPFPQRDVHVFAETNAAKTAA